MKIIKIKKSLFSTLQDMGRVGYTDIGLTRSGAMDEYSYLLANTLLGDREKVCVEIAGVFVFEAVREFSFCVSGVDGVVKINSKEHRINRTFNIKSGDEVAIYPKKGNFLYLCVKNGIKCKKLFGSCSVSVKEKIGTFLKPGDVIEANMPKLQPVRYAYKLTPSLNEVLSLRIVLGYEKDEVDLKEFFEGEYEIASFNRQAAVLKGNVGVKREGIISSGVTFGTVQITAAKNPVVLLKEYQTIGGFVRVGSVIPNDCFKLSQHKGKVRFKEISLEDAKKEVIDFYNFFKKLTFSYYAMYH